MRGNCAGYCRAPSAGLKAIFVDAQADDSCVKCLARNPSLLAAPFAPETRPWHCANAVLIISLSRSISVVTNGTTGSDTGDDARFNHVSSIENVSLSQRITARSMTFCSSRMFIAWPHRTRPADLIGGGADAVVGARRPGRQSSRRGSGKTRHCRQRHVTRKAGRS